MFDEEDRSFWEEVLREETEKGEFPRCRRCYSKKPFETECLNWEQNVWKVKCLDCKWEKTRKGSMAMYENCGGVLFIGGKKAEMPSFMKKN